MLSRLEAAVGLLILSEITGEREFSERVRIACRRLSWETKVFHDRKQVKSVDWVWVFDPYVEKPAGEAYLMLFEPNQVFFECSGHLKRKYRDYTGYLATYADRMLLLQDVKGDKKRVFPGRWYPTVHYFPYQTVTPNALIYFIAAWGNRVREERYKVLQEELAKTSYARLYGSPRAGKKFGPAYRGTIPFDGESVIRRIQEAGVALVLHSDDHLLSATPSSRIFEAAAASAVIISDLNPFVIENFGDSVLYIDQTASGLEMAQQIDAHMNWIQAHPEEALSMAERAHQIFETHFLLEEQLQAFKTWRDSLISR